MRKITMSLLLALGLGVCLPVDAKKEHILPVPHEITVKSGVYTLEAGSAVTVAGVENSSALLRFFQEFGITDVTFDKTATTGDVVVKMVDQIEGAFDHQVPLFENEAYLLEVANGKIQITAVTPTGVIRAAQTLTQLAEGWDGQTGVNLEQVTISDWPAFKVRGFMHDVGRSFISFEELKNEIDLLSRFKVNVFHWHMTEKLAWRFEVKKYPQLTEDKNMIRYAGQYYTQDQCRQLVDYAAERGMKVIPEIDMPGHSDVFTKAMGFDMQSAEGIEALKHILDEVAVVFEKSPYIHIGGDEVAIKDPKYLENMANYVRAKNKKVVMWNQLVAGAPTAAQCDMTQLWATRGNVVKGLPNIDCRYNYTNHFDVYADLVGIYKSNIYYETQGTNDVAGTISAAWNDNKTKTEKDIVLQNNMYANILASAERAWKGGGKQYIEKGGTLLPNSGEEYNEFADFERRFLFHKDHSLKNEPIPYVMQSNVRWRITDPFPNGGDNALLLPPETDKSEILPDFFQYEGNTYGTHMATGAGFYLRHIWHPTIPSFFQSPSNNQTAYAWTYVYSEKEQQVGAQIEFYTYSRSGSEKAPLAGQWDRRGSKVWLNGVEIEAPQWEQADKSIPQDHPTIGLTNENFTARDVVPLTLKAGWNKVFMRLPHVNQGGTGRDKWQFTFVFTTPDGKHAVDGLIYSPNQCKDAEAEKVAGKLSEVKASRNAQVKDQPGYFPTTVAEGLDAVIARIEKTLSQDMSKEDRAKQIGELNEALKAFNAALAGAQLIQPKLSKEGESFYYTLSTPLRGNRNATSMGSGAKMVGVTTPTTASYWKFVSRADGDLDIVNFAEGSYIAPTDKNLTTQSKSPSKGWTLKKSDAVGTFIIVSGSSQFNQSQDGPNYYVFNWGGGNNIADLGCKYAIKAVDVKDLQVDPSKPEAGKNYYFINKHMGGDQYFYDNGGGIGFAASKVEKKKAYVWTCEAAPNGHFYFRNMATGQYFGWKGISTTAYEWAVTTEQVTNQGCYRLQAVKQGGSNILVGMQGGFDQANRGNFYDQKYSSDFRFELCTNTEWDDQPVAPISYYSSEFGQNNVRIFWKSTSTNDAAGLVANTGSYLNVSAKSNLADITAEDQLWSLVGDENGFYLQNVAAGADYALHVGGRGNGAEAKLVKKATACKWVLVKNGNTFAIAPADNKGMGLNSYGGARNPLKLYAAGDPGSQWVLQPNIVEAFKMTTEIAGENPYGNANVPVGNLRFVVNGQVINSVVNSGGAGENIYYLPAEAKVEIIQANGIRGFVNGGLFLDGQETAKVAFTVEGTVGHIKAIFRADTDNGIVLYFTPDVHGKPYRIPAIATAKNGDIFAISDNRPCGRDIGFGEVDLKCRISKDNGQTWGKEFFIADGVGDNHGGQVWKTGFGDAAVVADRDRNELLVMMVCGKTVCWDGNYIPNSSKSNPNRVAQVRAKLNEQTGEWEWTPVKEVTESVYSIFATDGNKENIVRSLFIGSGRICQSRVVKVKDYYRLYCAVWNLEGSTGKNKGNRVIYSDDFGVTWNVLGGPSSRPAPGGDEPKCEEMPDGSVILSSRANGRIFNIFTFNDLKSATGKWGSPVTSNNSNNGIVSNGNQTNGEIMLVNAVRQSDKVKVVVALQSTPWGEDRSKVGFCFKEVKPSVYHNVTAFASNWIKGLQVSQVGSAYSTMALQKNNKLGFFFEEEPGNYCMVYLPLTIEQITKGKYALDEEAYQTGVGQVVIDHQVKNEAIYDLAGRRVQNPEKGIYIVNGKKIFLK